MSDFNLSTYISAPWYIQQQMPTQYLPANRFNCVTASYVLKDRPEFWGWTISVQNRAVDDNGEASGGDICAEVPDDSVPAGLRVAPCFLPTFLGGPYWVLDYNEEEGYALVSGGQPTIETDEGCRTGDGTNDAGLWIFTREVFPAAGLVQKVRDTAQSMGFDLRVLQDVNHEGCTYGSAGAALSQLPMTSPGDGVALISALKKYSKRVQQADGEQVAERRTQACPPVQPMSDFNLSTYISAPWYIQQQMPTQYLPANGFNCVTASYVLEDRPYFWGWTITVQNRAVYDNGEAFGGDICAEVPDDSVPAGLRVAPCFLPTFLGGPYWVLDYSEEEGYALVSGGQPTIETDEGCRTGDGTNDAGLWIFTRAVFPPAGLVEKVRNIAKSKGFDLSVLSDVAHDGCTYS